MNVDIELKDLDGNPILMNESGEKATLRKVAIQALLIPAEKELGEVKAKRYALAMKLHSANGDCKLDPDETKQIKDQVGIMFAPLVVGQVWELLKS